MAWEIIHKDSWEITDSQIQALWTEIWPKIVAIGWLDDKVGLSSGNEDYQACFEKSASFRKNEVKRVADTLVKHGQLRLEWDSNIPICVADDEEDLDIHAQQIVNRVVSALDKNSDIEEPFGPEARPAEGERPDSTQRSGPEDLYGQTYFHLNHKGILLPWPDTPDQYEISVGYAQGGGSLPRKGPPWSGALQPTQEALFEDLTTGIDWSYCNEPDVVDCPDPSEPVLTGVALLTLFKKWGEEVGTVWAYEAEDKIRNHLKDHVMPEVWSSWPPFLTEEAVKDHNFTIVRPPEPPSDPTLELKVPVPAPQPGEETIFKELIVGQATNPMYSNCY